MMLVETYAAASRKAEATVSAYLFNDGKRIGEVRSGSDIGVRRLERAVVWLSAHWPQGVAWPEGIPRPAVPDGEKPPVEAAE
ncbi:hypothetical protein [Rhizobium sp. SGZ-381]|uniref:hypothetical protein n=1 Tax=Rhizobium sp. SGZ-381 TaxID=3342800 RepID=UPI00366BD49C